MTRAQIAVALILSIALGYVACRPSVPVEERTGANCVKICDPMPVYAVHPHMSALDPGSWCICRSGRP